MEYNQIEKNLLEEMQRHDFRNIKKSELLHIASCFQDVRPEVAKEILNHFPEFTDLMKSLMIEYKEVIDKFIASDDESLKLYFNLLNKESDNNIKISEEFFSFVKKVRDDCVNLLENPNLPPEIYMEVLNREMELVEAINKKDSEIRQFQKELEEQAYKKDSEKRAFNLKCIGGVGMVVLAIAGVTIGALGGKVDFKLPNKN